MLFTSQSNGASFRSTADGPGHMQLACAKAAARQYEVLQWPDSDPQLIDQGLEIFNMSRLDTRNFKFTIGREGQIGPQVEELLSIQIPGPSPLPRRWPS